MDDKQYKPLTTTEKVLIYEFLERVKENAKFREALLRAPEEVLSTASPASPFSSLLRPSLLEALGRLRRVALEEAGIDVAPYREYLVDNGFKLRADDKD